MEAAKAAQDAEVMRGVDTPTAPPATPPAATRTSFAEPDTADSSVTADNATPPVTPPAPAVASGPQPSLADVNASVALAPPISSNLPAGPPIAFNGLPPGTASDAPPIGMPRPPIAPAPAQPAAGPANARDAITSQLTNRVAPPPVAPPQAAAPAVPAAIPPAASGIQQAPPIVPPIQQAPPPTTARPIPEPREPTAEPVPPPAPAPTPRMQAIEKALGVVGDPMQRDRLTRLYQQEQANALAVYNQKMEIYKYERGRWDSSPERLIARRQADAAYQKEQQGIVPPTPAAAAPGDNDPRLGTPASPQRTGIPTPPPTPPGVTVQKWSELQAPNMAKAVDAVEKAVPQFNEALATLKLAREHPGREWGVGATSEIAKKMPGTAAYGFGKIMDQIAGKNFLAAYSQLKGGGSITEVEGGKAEAAQARLATAQTKQDFDKAMNDFESALRTDLETTQRKVNAPVTAWRLNGDNASVAPDIGERRGNMVYLGGNPALPGSWRAVR